MKLHGRRPDSTYFYCFRKKKKDIRKYVANPGDFFEHSNEYEYIYFDRESKTIRNSEIKLDAKFK